MNNKKIIKTISLLVTGLIILLSLGKTLGIQGENNLIEQKVKELSLKNTDGSDHNNKKTNNAYDNKTYKEDRSEVANNKEDDVLAEISQQHEGLPVLTQEDEIKTDYFAYRFKDISISKEQGDFIKDLGVHGHIDEDGNIIGPYSYLILNVEFESYKDSQILYLNMLRPFICRGAGILGGWYEAFTSNNTVPVGINIFKYEMKEGEVRDFNIVYLVHDEYLEDSELYVYINNFGVTYGQDLKNKKLVKLDWEGEGQ